MEKKQQLIQSQQMLPPNRIRELREARGWSQDELAARVGAHAITISKLENRKMGADKWLVKLAATFGIEPQDVIGRPAGGETVEVIGAVQAGAWASNPEWSKDDRYSIAVPDIQEWRGSKKFASEVRGESMNLIYPNGSIVVWTTAFDTPAPRKRYIIQRERDGEYEVTLKEFAIDSTERAWLLPKSSDPACQTPIEINGNEDDVIKIIGQIIWSLRNEDR